MLSCRNHFRILRATAPSAVVVTREGNTNNLDRALVKSDMDGGCCIEGNDPPVARSKRL